MKKYYFFVLLIAIILFVGLIRFLSGDEDTWLCQNGQWIKHGQPSVPMPQQPCR